MGLNYSISWLTKLPLNQRNNIVGVLDTQKTIVEPWLLALKNNIKKDDIAKGWLQGTDWAIACTALSNLNYPLLNLISPKTHLSNFFICVCHINFIPWSF